MVNVQSLKEYEQSLPAGTQKLMFDNYVIRAYVTESGELHVMAHRRSENGNEQLPLAYLMGTNYIQMQKAR